MRAQRSAATRIRSASSARDGAAASSASSCSMSAPPSTMESGLFSSCATPARREPKAAIFSLCSSASRWRWSSAAAARASRRAATWRSVLATVASRSAKSIGLNRKSKAPRFMAVRMLPMSP